jgi:tetratricopeptide (TPR) repeat protein
LRFLPEELSSDATGCISEIRALTSVQSASDPELGDFGRSWSIIWLNTGQWIDAQFVMAVRRFKEASDETTVLEGLHHREMKFQVSKEADMAEEISALIKHQNELLSQVADRFPAKPSVQWKILQIIFKVALGAIALLPLWAFAKEIDSIWERYHSFRMYVSSGDILLQKNELEAARKSYAEALRLVPGNTEALIKATKVTAITETRKYENIYRRLKPEEEKEIQRLVSDCTLLVRMRQRDGQAYQLLGLALQLAKRLDDSVEAFNSALRYFPQDYEIYNQLGVTYNKKGDFDKAKQYFGDAIRIASGAGVQYARPYNNRGFALLLQKKYAEAKQDLERAIAIDISYGSAYQNRGEVFFDQALSLPAESRTERARLLTDAMRDFLQTIMLDPDHADGYYNLGNVFYQSRRWEAALEYFDKAGKLDPSAPDIHENKGAALAMMQRNEEAATEFSLAIELAPGKISAYRSRALVYRQLGHFEKALADEAKTAALEGRPE